MISRYLMDTGTAFDDWVKTYGRECPSRTVIDVLANDLAVAVAHGVAAHVPHRAAYAPDELDFPVRRRLIVQAAERAATGAERVVALHEVRRQAVRGKFVPAPQTGKEPALVAARLRVDEKCAVHGCLSEAHSDQWPTGAACFPVSKNCRYQAIVSLSPASRLCRAVHVNRRAAFVASRY